jgi:hypothetical protein
LAGAARLVLLGPPHDKTLEKKPPTERTSTTRWFAHSKG